MNLSETNAQAAPICVQGDEMGPTIEIYKSEHLRKCAQRARQRSCSKQTAICEDRVFTEF